MTDIANNERPIIAQNQAWPGREIYMRALAKKLLVSQCHY